MQFLIIFLIRLVVKRTRPKGQKNFLYFCGLCLLGHLNYKYFINRCFYITLLYGSSTKCYEINLLTTTLFVVYNIVIIGMLYMVYKN